MGYNEFVQVLKDYVWGFILVFIEIIIQSIKLIKIMNFYLNVFFWLCVYIYWEILWDYFDVFVFVIFKYFLDIFVYVVIVKYKVRSIKYFVKFNYFN